MNRSPWSRLVALCLLGTLAAPSASAQNPWNGKVVLQGYWWDYWNNNYQNGWSNYLADLAPRLRDMGIDAVWIPPSIKNASTGSNGYSPFDHYDLGDKYQKGSLKTRLGSKDELLRSIGIMHANGMDVIQDVVFNHMDNAGSSSGSGGSDPAANNGDGNSYKNFRYVSYARPATDESATDYLGRSGRWPKNWPNFHSNAGHVCNSGDWCAAWFGPDICFYSGAYGQSSNATFNPTQGADYMRTQTRNWFVWMKKQTGVDGFRLDAVKHFPHWATQDFLYNVKYNAGWANGGANMFAVGEYVGSGTQLDTWINDVRTSNSGTEDLVGTFDFSLRQSVKNMVSAGGSYDLGTLPGAQQGNRYRTVPFVNNHDTFRPTKDANGNYTGWDAGNELGGGHIDPFDPRLAVAYAVTFAVDGSPQVFFEDLFNVSNGKRYTHQPTSAADLPVRSDIANIIWCHQKLNFKKGSYKVRWQAADLLIIERGYKAGPENSYAIIGMNDNWNTWQSANIQTDFGPNRQLHDYSGANANDIWTDANGRVTIWVPPCDGSNLRRGYSIWGPAGITGGFNPAQRSTTQEWEMANDLGDNHASSLKQGGALPASSTALRYAGRVFNEANKTITVNVFPGNSAYSLTVGIYSNADVLLSSTAGTGNLTLTYTPTSTAFYKIKVRNTSTSNPSQKCFVKATYTSPRTASTASFPARTTNSAEAVKGPVTEEGDAALVVTVRPGSGVANVRFKMEEPGRRAIGLFSLEGKQLQVVGERAYAAGWQNVSVPVSGLAAGTYIVNLTGGGEKQVVKLALAQ
ncbi:alpha-amylase domain-containing protein [Flaviaesturariibacter amylovorans]|uniref:Glycosyl hydrolase family 13 catalytic domain-containing protein n=1 Tax=Flaviaesturariibacter amylovorans TaxID=1084520 RepID=A0ABP8H2I6_9BACT